MQAPLLVPAHRGFLLRRLHSLSGVFPVGVFLVEHLWTNAKAMAGQAIFDRAVRDINHLPLLPLIEIFGIFLPLAFHAGYGVKLALDGRPNVGKYPYSRNWLYMMQRVTGLVAFAFIAWHLWEFRIAKLLGRMGPDDFYPTLVSHLSSTVSGLPVMASSTWPASQRRSFTSPTGSGGSAFRGGFVSRGARKGSSPWHSPPWGPSSSFWAPTPSSTSPPGPALSIPGTTPLGLRKSSSPTSDRCSVVNP